jgi:hypothetical protein
MIYMDDCMIQWYWIGFDEALDDMMIDSESVFGGYPEEE